MDFRNRPMTDTIQEVKHVTVTYHGDDSGRPSTPQRHLRYRSKHCCQSQFYQQYQGGPTMKDCQTELAALWRSRSLDCIQDVLPPESPPPASDLRRKSICVSRLNQPILGRDRGCETIHSSRAGSLSYYRHKKRKCFIENGFVELALEKMVTRHYGEETWQEIKGISLARLERNDLLTGMFTDEQLTYDVIEATAQVVGCQKSKILEMFGEMFFEFCGESGYDKILQVLGGTLMEFLQNLDALHDHLATIYPGMKAPSFRCMEREDGSMILFFSSERAGLEHVVLGLVKSAARELHGKDVSVTIIASSEDSKSHNFQFLIEETTENTDCLSPVTYRLSDGLDEYGGLIGTQQFISPSDFCQFLPFHFMFNRRLRITQTGSVVSRVIPEVEDGYLPDIFLINRPDIVMGFDEIRQHSSTVFVLSARHEASVYRENRLRARTPDLIRIPEPNLRPRTPEPVFSDGQGRLAASVPRRSLPNDDVPALMRNDTPRMRLRGQMLYLPECDEILFLCSPYVSNLEELHERGLYLSDLPVHDATRDLILLSEQFRAEYELTQRLEMMTQRLQQTYKELEIEKQLTDKLVYSILPPSVANKLRQGQAVEAVKYDLVTILFSGLCDFDQICCTHSPIAIVNLLNDLYTKFDMLADPKVNNVYKVETAGDKYLVASGLPERNTTHARNIAILALDMMEVAKEIRIDSGTVRLCIGVHSGTAVAGVIGQQLPRYCVFGDTVNIASRMETTGLPNKINISEATYKLIKEQDADAEAKFEFTERGPMTIKGKSKPIVTYILYRKSRGLPALQALLEHGLVLNDPGSPPLELLQQRRRSEGTCRYHEAGRHARRMSCVPSPSSSANNKSKSTLDVPKVITDLNGLNDICDGNNAATSANL